MQPQTPSRKRPAPGTSPYEATDNMNAAPVPDMSWGVPTTSAATYEPTFNDQPLFDMNPYGLNSSGSFPQMSGFQPTNVQDSQNTPSNQLALRDRNTQLMRGGSYGPSGQLGGTEVPQEILDDQTDDEELVRRANIAKRDAQAKRKQIPPFVQKLWSFLDSNEQKYDHLIKWSDDGNSFIVVDEDKFAQQLIPELFKHNNYASFVRQLNMYGFHKKVGLNANSMRQAESKQKTPSEYYNKYFRRGRPELLWLIQKPKNASNAKRKKDAQGQGDSDDEQKFAPDANDNVGQRQLDRVHGPSQDVARLPAADLRTVRDEVQQLQRQQKYITSMLTQLKRQNDQMYQQASAFQQLHERHENSINAILTFLATFYNRGLDGQNGQNLQDMFKNMNHDSPQHGNVVDLGGEYQDAGFEDNVPTPRQNRRPLALLPAPSSQNNSAPSSARPPTSPQVHRASIFPDKQPQNARHSSPRLDDYKPVTGSPLVKEESTTPRMDPVPTTDDFMNVIQNANSNAPASISQASNADLSQTLNTMQQNASGSNAPLTPQERTDILNQMNTFAPRANGRTNSATAQPGVPSAAPNTNPHNNALVNPQPAPSLQQFTDHNNQLETLRRLSQEHGENVQRIAERLQPLSSQPLSPAADTSMEGQDYVSGGGAPADFDWINDPNINDPSLFPNTDNADNFNWDDFTANGDMDTGMGATNAGFGAHTGAGYPNFMGGVSEAAGQENDPLGLLAVPDGDPGSGRVESIGSETAGSTPRSTTLEIPGVGPVEREGSESKKRRTH